MNQRFEQILTKDKMKMTKRHMKRYSISLVIRERKIKEHWDTTIKLLVAGCGKMFRVATKVIYIENTRGKRCSFSVFLVHTHNNTNTINFGMKSHEQFYIGHENPFLLSDLGKRIKFVPVDMKEDNSEILDFSYQCMTRKKKKKR